MRIALIFPLFLSAALFSPLTPAMSLGEGQILSQVNEPFSANIALLGEYDKDVRFYQVKGAECKASIIGKTANGCDSLYEGQLIFLIKKRPDGQYFLRVTGGRSDELFYRIIIKSKLPVSGTVYNAFEFLPEFKSNSDTAPSGAAEGEVSIDRSLPSGKYGVVMDKIIEVLPEDAPRDEPQLRQITPVEQASHKLAEASDETRQASLIEPKRGPLELAQPKQVVAKPAAKKIVEGKLTIGKYGEYSDDIYALQKENAEIERQISLLEKQIDLLKEVARLKTQIGAPPAPEAPVAVSPNAHAPPSGVRAVPVIAIAAAAPAPMQEQYAAHESGVSLWKWMLFAVLLSVLSALLLLLYRKNKKWRRKTDFVDRNNHVLKRFKSENDKPSLDLTGAHEKLKL